MFSNMKVKFKFDTICFEIYLASSQSTWKDASETCCSIGMQLLSLDTAQKNLRFTQLTKTGEPTKLNLILIDANENLSYMLAILCLTIL
jgi:hypothetical protein